MTPVLIKLSETDKRVIICFLLIFILLFVLIASIGLLIKKIMKTQGSKSNDLLRNVVEAKYFAKEKDLIKFGRKKNILQFYKEARIPFIIMLGACLLLLLYCLFSGNWDINLFDYKTEGIGTLFTKYDWSAKSEYITKVFFLKLIANMPPVISKAHFVWTAWVSYIVVPVLFIGGIWFLICTQAYIARSFEIRRIAKGIFRKKLVPEEQPSTPVNN